MSEPSAREAPPPEPSPAEQRDRRTPTQRRLDRPPPEPLSRRQTAIAGAFIGALYAVGMIGRGETLAGIVGGVLAAILLFLVLREVGRRQRRRIAARERRRSGPQAR